MHMDQHSTRRGFTFIEVMLVVVIIVVLSSVAIPFFSGSMKGHSLRNSGRLIQKMAGFGRSMAIVREETLTLVLNPDTNEIYIGGRESAPTNAADGYIDQDAFKNLGYVDQDEDELGSIGIEREERRFLPDGLEIRNFDKDWTIEDDEHPDVHLVRFYPNGQSEWFEVELVDSRGRGLKLVNDPISGRVSSENLQ